ncbi:MAG: hypothetical protein GY708_28270, partial [Actinomycetia bacterium]|nr:hypothetical protein [Actinomycetes bacterium]
VVAEFDLATLDADPVSFGVREVLTEGSTPVARSLSMFNLTANRWPSDGVVLLGLEGRQVILAIALHENGVSFVGDCLGGLSNTWNAHIETMGLDHPVDAVDILLSDPTDQRLLPALDLAPEEPEPKPIPWVDRAPDERSYDGAPAEVRERLHRASVVIVLPEEWPQGELGGICSRTPEALHQCYGFSMADRLSTGEFGWQMDVAVVPGEPVTLLLGDEVSYPLDLVEMPTELLEPVSKPPGDRSDFDFSILVDFRPTYPSAVEVFDLVDDPTVADLIEVGTIPTPEPVITPLGGDGP